MESQGTTPKPTAPHWPGLTVVLVALSCLVVVLLLALPPHAVLDKADLVGYAICHRIPERSFLLGGRQMPLCARCTGTFLGAILGLAATILRRRHLASRLPPAPVLGLLVAFVGIWAFDGLNSYLTLFPGAPHLYEPMNWLRLTTGCLNGLAIITFVTPVFGFTLWREPSSQPVIGNIGEIAVLLPAAAVLVFVVQAQIGALLYPLAILSSLGVLILLTLVNTMIAAVVLRREGYARTWREAAVPLVVGLALAVLMIAGMDLLRDYLTASLGISFY